jgi:hypothetical protein
MISMNQRILINDSWVLSRAGHFSPSFSNFLSQIAPNIPEEKKKEVQGKLEETIKRKMENADQILESRDFAKLKELNNVDVPVWVKPFVSRIVQDVQARAQKIL